MTPLGWRGCQAYLLLLAVVALIAAAWTHRYWNRGEGRAALVQSAVASRLPAAIQESVAKQGVRGAVAVPAMALWVYGPIAMPLVALGCGGLIVALRRRHRWAAALTPALAALALPVIYGGWLFLRGMEDRHYFARSPYVRTYGALALAVLAGSLLLAVVLLVDRLRLARRGG